MRTRPFLIIFLAAFALSAADIPEGSNPARFVLNSMIKSVDANNEYQYVVKSDERIDGKLIYSKTLFKYRYKPKRIYMKALEPNSGVEILFGDGMYDGHALINPNGFPYFNIKLDPEGWIMRDDHHHSLHDAGFHFICRVLEHSMIQVKDKFDRYFIYRGDTTFDGKKLFKIEIDVFDFEYVDYKVQENENILDISDRLWLNDYLIVDKNADVDDFEDVSPGQIIKLPNAYARKIIVYVDSKTYFPYIEEIHDEEGVYERYTFIKIDPNPSFTDIDFNEDNEEYGF